MRCACSSFNYLLSVTAQAVLLWELLWHHFCDLIFPSPNKNLYVVHINLKIRVRVHLTHFSHHDPGNKFSWDPPRILREALFVGAQHTHKAHEESSAESQKCIHHSKTTLTYTISDALVKYT